MTQRILQIIPSLDQSGAEKQMAMLATGLPRDQFDVHVCVLTRDGPVGERLKSAGVEYRVINKSWKIDPAAWLRLKRHIQHVKPDVVHTWLFAANSYGRQAALRCGVKTIIGAERCVDTWKSGWQFKIDRYLARHSQAIVCNSGAIRDFYETKGIDPKLFRVIHNGVQATTRATSEQRQELLDELKLPADAKLIGTVGRLWPQKRMKDLIWAADLLKCVRDDTHLLIVGDGPQRWRLERFRDQCELGDRVHFLGHRTDAKRIIASLDMLWLASAFEGQSNVVLEAMAAGVPVIATDIVGTRDLVVPDETGFLVPVGDRAAFVKQTRKVFEEAGLAESLSVNSQARIANEFSVDQMIARHAELYTSFQ